MYGLIDCNNFFVSCERIFDLSLHGQPVAVLSNNDGCVISRSNELKALGITMGMPFFQLRPFIDAYKIKIRSSNYELYADISSRVMQVLSDMAPKLEPYSIDEAFLEVNPTANFDLHQFASMIRERIWKWVGIPTGIGFAKTKTLAKIANQFAKKLTSGVFVMPDDYAPLLDKVPVQDVWGVGRRSSEKLLRLGITTAAQLATAEQRMLMRKFNICLARTALELRGKPAVAEEDLDKLAQSITCSRSFGQPVFALSSLSEAVAYYISLASERLRRQGLVASGVNVYFQHTSGAGGGGAGGGGFHHHSNWGNTNATVMLPQPTSAESSILQAVMPLLPAIFKPKLQYRKAGVMFFGLESAARQQLGLFADPKAQLRDGLSQAVDKLNRQYGKGTVFHLAQGLEKTWLMKREHLSPCFTTKWNDIYTLKEKFQVSHDRPG